ncbi:MAG: PIN domain-containing protein [Planctomycetaceae bacterium]|jgi:tRNA(fMet)-specific endonuclease VapC|nr:PIN domain-containing protein [Planctomycetaceae bacterium]
MKTYSLDSNIVTYCLRNDKVVIDKLNIVRKNGYRIDISPIVYYETIRGLSDVNSLQKLRLFNSFCQKLTIGTIEQDVAETAASIYVSLKRVGRLAEDADILIAAYCVMNDFVLVTHNTKHFENIDKLLIEGWCS